MNVELFPGARAAAQACGRAMAARISAALQREGVANIAISGGTSPQPMFELLAREPLPWQRVHLFWADERAVPPDHDRSNYRLAFESLIEPAGIPDANVHRVLAELHPEEAARRYVLDIREHFAAGPAGLPHFDVVHLGIGPDAHTASLFPGEPLIADREGIAAAVYVDKFAEWRITLLPGTLLAAREIVVLAAGADKREALRQILHGQRYDPLRWPAQILAHEAENVSWFLDEQAAPER